MRPPLRDCKKIQLGNYACSQNPQFRKGEECSLKLHSHTFGGKSRVASLVWDAIGDVDNYIEPFAGSLAVLLGRPSDTEGCETVNDADCYLANFWRAISHAPDEVAKWCDWPVNEVDLLSRHLWLVDTGKKRIGSMESDPDFYDAKVAGWWVWGIAAWIGSGWCVGNGPWKVINGEVVKTKGAGGQWRQLPHLGDEGRGVNRKLPHLGNEGQGGTVNAPLIQYFHQLADRLRKVRVCCGDWSRVVTNGAMSYGGTVGVFLDPPYLGDVRCKDLYRVDNHDIAHSVREWAIANGDDPRMRIVLAGYHAEHADKMPASWRMHSYSASKAYGTTRAVGEKEGNDANRHNERLWFSPNCLDSNESSLFGIGARA